MINLLVNTVLAVTVVMNISASTLFGADAEESKSSSFERFAKYIPLNEPIDQIEIPQYDEKGVRTALVKAHVARRINDTKFTMEMLEIQVFEKGILVMTLTTPNARYNLEQSILASRAPSKIVHHGKPKTTAHGHGMVFDIKRRVGSFLNGTSVELKVPKSKSMKRP